MPAPLPEDRLIAVALGHVERRGMHAWGLHGAAHWWRVRHNALLLAPGTGADARVVRLFAIFHDAFREDDGYDAEHGPRAAAWLREVRAGRAPAADPACEATERELRTLCDDDFGRLAEACRLQTAAIRHNDATVATSFTTDRLDLGRVDDTPDPDLMPVARSLVDERTIAVAMARTRLGLARTDAEKLAETWGVTPPARLFSKGAG